MIKNVKRSVEEKDLSHLLSSKRLTEVDMTEISNIRKKSDVMRCSSQTSMNYQNDVLDALNRAASIHAGPIVEIGIFKGGLTCQLAYIAKKFNRKLYAVDISAEFCEEVKENLKSQGLLHDGVNILCGDVVDFFKKEDFTFAPPCFVVVDALHAYAGARLDICTILTNAPNVPVIAFHDYSFKSNTVLQVQQGYPIHDDDVAAAIIDVIGDTDSLHPIGEFFITNDKENVTTSQISYNYHIENCSEGVLLFTSLLKASAFTNAYSFCFLNEFRRYKNETFKTDNSETNNSETNQIMSRYHLTIEYVRMIKKSRWIKLGRKLGFLKGINFDEM